MSLLFKGFSKTALLLSSASLLFGFLVLRSNLEWTWKVGLLLASFGLYMAVMLFEAWRHQKEEDDNLKVISEK